MNVGLITSSLTQQNGWGRYSINVINALNAENIKTTVISSDKTAVDFPVIAANPILGGGIKNLFTIFRDALRLRSAVSECDIIHMLTEPDMFLGAFLGRPYVISTHGTYAVRYLQKKITRPVAKRIFEGAAGVVCTSKFTCKKMSMYCTLPATIDLPNGVDIVRFRPAGDIGAAPLLITVGELKPRKGQDLGIAAIEILKKTYPGVRYYIVGNDRNDFGNELHRLVESKGLQNEVIFTGSVSEDELLSYYHRARVCILPSRTDETGSFEGYPLSIMEGNACGLPAIGTYGCGAENFIESGKNGYLIHQDNVAELVGAIKKIIENPGEYKRLSASSVAVAVSYSWSENAKKLIEFYKKVLHR